MAEIDDAQLASLRQIAGLVEKVWAHPEARKSMAKALKLQDPNIALPEIDAKNEVLELLEKEREARVALEKRIEKEADDRETDRQRREFHDGWQQQRAALRQAGYMDEGIDKIEEHAKKYAIPNLEVAAAHWEKLNPPQSPARSSSGSWNFFDTPDTEDTGGKYMKALFESGGDNEGALDAEISRALTDFRGQRGTR